MSDAQGAPDDYEQSISENVETDLRAKEPSEDEKEELRERHQNHLVRHTTSKLSMEPEVMEGVEAQATAEIPDMYCFTCGEWVGLSGVDLRGTPRSTKDAFYLGGMPQEVLQAKNMVMRELNDVAYRLLRDVEHLENKKDAYEFIATELEQVADQ